MNRSRHSRATISTAINARQPTRTARAVVGVFFTTHAPRGTVMAAGTDKRKSGRQSTSRQTRDSTTRQMQADNRLPKATPSTGPRAAMSNGEATRANPSPVVR